MIGFVALLSQCSSFSLIAVGRAFSAYAKKGFCGASTRKKSYLGREILPTSIKELPLKERHIGSKSRQSPSPEDVRGIDVDRVGFWQHAAPGHQCFDEVTGYRRKKSLKASSQSG
eukprot:1147254-Pelagomonas_calceolata.AAC.3